MELWLWGAIAILLLIVVVLVVKLRLMRKSADEICQAFAERLATATNTLIDVSSRDRYILRLASQINVQLRRLRGERQRFEQGDAELKEAVTNIAHDLRTPLTAISGYLQLLEREEKSETVARYLSLIDNRADALRELTEELFRYSVITSERELNAEPVAVNDVLEECIASAYGALTENGIVPQIRISEEKVERLLDRSALSRVFENIIANAVKYSDGDLSVVMDADGRVEFSNSAAALDSVAVGRLFDRFYTVETGRSSTGLGLSISKQLTERMGGRITADYRDGRIVISVVFSQNNGNL